MINTNIPHIIHYCWFGRKPLPKSAIRCIESWKKYLPGYEIKEWNEDNFDVNIIPYTAKAYEVGKYAFVSDYARFWVLYHFGGLYFDTDVELIRNIDDIIAAGPFMGCERPYKSGATPNDLGVAPGLGLGLNPGLGLCKEMLDEYAKLSFYNADGTINLTTIVQYTGMVLCRHGLENRPGIQNIDGINIYPQEYFAPKDYQTGELKITENTRSIHHYDGSWHTPYDKFKIKVSKLFGKRLTALIVAVKHMLRF